METKRKAIKVILASLALIPGILYGILRYAFNFIFERDPLANFEPMTAGSPFWEKVKKDRNWLVGMEPETVSITSEDGYRLVGHYLKCEEPERLVICFHGWRADWDYNYGTAARALHDKHCSLLMPEQRSQGNSEGPYNGMGLLEYRDVNRWAEFGKQLAGKLPVYLYGVSLGASCILFASGDLKPEMVRGLIADCGFASAYDVIADEISSFHLPGHLMTDVLNHMAEKRIGIDLHTPTTAEGMAGSRIPALFIHGREDRLVPLDDGIRNYENYPAEKKMIIFDDARHGQSYHQDPVVYWRTVTEFFKEREA